MTEERNASRVWLAGDRRDYPVEDRDQDEDGDEDGDEDEEEQDWRTRGGNKRAGMDGWEYESRRMIG